MKNLRNLIKYLLIVLISGSLGLSCQDDFLDTVPTQEMSGAGLFATATGALVPLNGIYRMMYTQGWSTTANVQQCDGLTAWNLAADVMGEDMVMKAQGSGWYWFDAIYSVKQSFTSSAWRSYDLWNGYYKLIANANYIIDAEETMEGTPGDINYVIGQGYAIRAYCYYQLVMWFARTYKGHESDLGVPLYTEPSAAGTEGQPRAPVSEVYALIIQDINKAIELLSADDVPAQKHRTHIDKYVASAIKARVCLTMEDWPGAEAAAKFARAGRSIGRGSDLTSGLNNVNLPNILWGAELIQDHLPGWGPFLWHMDAFTQLPQENYAFRAPKCISVPLYGRMGATDIRRQWWLPENSISSYIQVKFRFTDPLGGGDKIWMRVEEMYLAEAEALCRQGNFVGARDLLTELVRTRDPNYTIIANDGNELGAQTWDLTNSLLEEIIFQRRIELWGEYGRTFDIKRLKQGFTRTAAMGWPSTALIEAVNTQNPETWAWILTIPRHEFDGNDKLSELEIPEGDQNPVRLTP